MSAPASMTTASLAEPSGTAEPALRRRRHAPTRLAARIAVHVLLAAVGLASVVPLLWLLRSAFMDQGQIFRIPPQWLPDPVVWDNFSRALAAESFGRYFLNTLLLVVLIVPGTVLSCSFAAFSFSRLEWRGRGVAFGLIMTGLMLPYAVTLIPTFVAWQRLGWVGTYVPLVVPAWFAAGGAFYVFLLRQFFLTLPSDLDHAVYVDGGSPLTVYRVVALPLTKGPMILVAVFSTIAVWNDLLNPLIYLNDPSMYTLSLGLAAFTGMYSTQWALLMAASVITVAPMIVLFAFAQRYIVQGIALTGVKG
ncbi:binding-protein-dependent transport systems inner membrane component [Beutenbergia cavernae DSM 12333]|uniref:Binding-protein-dependent transport systems inner membrane component n=1 Tax=Beutenbergia cavernae (strain ATCC BAA-8 / DSM 12333 / CCUG 43141 / JCM 11478 / NBRC 16432 / NCIMB 13614 / HKI 0122) TaxID=471853 RepID=C5C2P2_BEUC1|nr:carbohydrate ABC transporter permease [Beutenbergia cavernae]ACQ79728.1 binding-protein-dependent transport systems inner membrane component [Beutenbergia cavernae DSM 12333]